MKKPLPRNLLQGIAAAVLSASVAAGCVFDSIPLVQADAAHRPEPILDFHVIGPTRAPKPPQPVATAKVIPVATPKPSAAPRASTRSLSGNATWYAYVVGGAAAGPGLRSALGSHWRYKTVTVCAGAHCVAARLSDWCLCSKGNRLIDLDKRLFAKLAAPSQGIVEVTIKW
jgi:hypothetical protein